MQNTRVYMERWLEVANVQGGSGGTSNIPSCDWSMQISLDILLGSHWLSKLRPRWRQVLQYKHTEAVVLLS